MAQPFVIFVGNLDPPATYQFLIKGVPQPLTGKTVSFSMRPVGSNALAINHVNATIVDAINGIVRYDWVGSDTALAGAYAAWFTATTTATGHTQDAPDFEVEVKAHATAGAQALVTVEELLDYMKKLNGVTMPKENDYQDLAELILVASDTCEQFTAHKFAMESAVSRDFTYDENPFVDLAPFDLRVATSITTDTDWSPTLLDTSRYRLEPRNKPDNIYTHIVIQPDRTRGRNFWGGPWQGFQGPASFGRQVTVVGDWGWPSIPSSIKYGVKALAARMYVNPLAAQVIRTQSIEYQFSRGAISGGSSAGDDLPVAVKTAWRPYVRSGTSG